MKDPLLLSSFPGGIFLILGLCVGIWSLVKWIKAIPSGYRVRRYRNCCIAGLLVAAASPVLSILLAVIL